MRRSTAILLLLLAVLPACREAEEGAPAAPAAAARPPLPDDDAGRVVARAIEAAGGWENWMRHRDVSYVSTLTVFDSLTRPVSETIFLHRTMLHDGVKTRLESIGLGEEVLFAFDGESEWMLQGDRLVTEPARTAFTRFHALSSVFWFSLPFVLAELPCEMTYLGSETDGDSRVEKVRVVYPESVPLPFDWLVLYFDVQSGQLDRVHVRALAEFLQHSLWLGLWREPRRTGGITYSRRRAFFPADGSGDIVGSMASEQLVEHVELDDGLAPGLFKRPLGVRGLTGEIES